MTQCPDSPEPPPHPDPEIEALLHFAPVRRRCVRGDGWSADVQRRFVAACAETGSVAQAAAAADRTESGAYKVRTSKDADEFAAAWDKAIALWHRRNPRYEHRGRPPRGVAAERAAAAPPLPPPPDPERDLDEGWTIFCEQLMPLYWQKLEAERAARLGGRIVAADFFARQLTHIEVILDLGGQAQPVLNAMRRGRVPAADIVATPMSLLLDEVRRQHWADSDEPDRPCLSAFGTMGEDCAVAPCEAYRAERDGPDPKAYYSHLDEQAEIAAEAQRLWEEKARADAAAWRARVEAQGGGEEAESPPGADRTPDEAP